jgi:hypothetical protein
LVDFTIIIDLFQEYYICHWRTKKYTEPKQHVKITEQADRFRNAQVNICKNRQIGSGMPR